MTISSHPHPKPHLNRAVQYGGAAVMAITALSVPLQVLLAFVTGGALFLLTAPLTLLLLLPLAMLVSVSPTIEISSEGLTLRPAVWSERLVHWDEIKTVKNYTLLPPEDSETVRRAMVGRKKYQSAAGIMLIIPNLPIQYRAAGFFAGEGFTPIIAITNRTHTGYDYLVKQITERFETNHEGTKSTKKK